MLKDRQTYEIIDPQDIGLNESVIALTARSGRAALVHRLELLGYDLTQEELDATYAKFLELADKKKEIHDYDLLYLVGDIDRMKQQSINSSPPDKVSEGRTAPPFLLSRMINSAESLISRA